MDCPLPQGAWLVPGGAWLPPGGLASHWDGGARSLRVLVHLQQQQHLFTWQGGAESLDNTRPSSDDQHDRKALLLCVSRWGSPSLRHQAQHDTFGSLVQKTQATAACSQGYIHKTSHHQTQPRCQDELSLLKTTSAPLVPWSAAKLQLSASMSTCWNARPSMGASSASPSPRVWPVVANSTTRASGLWVKDAS